MKNTIRGCISCMLPCGALDVIRIVHCNGKVQEISGTVKASDILKAYPKHVLKKPSSSSFCSEDAVVPKVVAVHPDAELRRGKIYFLMPQPNLSAGSKSSSRSSSSSTMKKRREHNESNDNQLRKNLLDSDDQYLSEILSEKSVPTQRDKGRGRVRVWRPHLASISESPSDVCSES